MFCFFSPSLWLVSPCACSDTLHLSVSKKKSTFPFVFFLMRAIAKHVEVEHPVSTLQHTRLAAAQCSRLDALQSYVWNSQPCGSAYSKAGVSAVQCSVWWLGHHGSHYEALPNTLPWPTCTLTGGGSGARLAHHVASCF